VAGSSFVESTARRFEMRSPAASLAGTLSAAPWRQAAGVLAVTLVVFLAVGYAGAWFLARGRGPLDVGFLDVWARWDALHFFAVAEHGYTGPGAEPHATAFFPGFPLALRAGTWLGLSPVAAGLAICAAASLVALAFLYRLAERDVGPGGGRRAVLYLALFPTAVFLVAPYSEALFLAGAISAFYFARGGRWTLVGPAAAVAMSARAAGAFLLFGLALEFLRGRDFSTRRLRDALGALLLGTLPLVAYSVYLAGATGDPFRFITDQKLGWRRELTDPAQAFLSTWGTWSSPDYPSNWIFAWRLEIVAAVVGVAIVAWALAKREWGYAGYCGATMAALLASTGYFSIPRMLLSLFPAVVFLASSTARHPWRHELLVAVFAPLATLG